MKIKLNNTLSLVPISSVFTNDLVRLLNDPDIYNNTFKIPFPYTEKHARDWIKKTTELETIQGITNNWALCSKEEGLIGGLGLHQTYGADSHKDEIGYWLGKPYWNKGIMTEALKKFCEYCFEHRELSRIEALVFSHNHASMRVLEKVGFEKEGYLKKCYIKQGRYVDSVLYALVL